jgi:cytochrome c
MKYLVLAAAVSLVGCGPNDAGLAKKVDLSKEQLAAIENRITPFGVVNVEGGNPEVSTMPILPGELKYAACGACHGANGGGGVGPALKGQSIDYIVGRLNQYKAGEKVGSQSNLMWGQAAGLSDQDIQELAEFIVTL